MGAKPTSHTEGVVNIRLKDRVLVVERNRYLLGSSERFTSRIRKEHGPWYRAFPETHQAVRAFRAPYEGTPESHFGQF